MIFFSADFYCTLPDDALVLKVAQQPQVFAVLLDRYRNMVVSMANSYAADRADAEDYAQEGLLGLLAAALTYSPDGSAGFRTYAVVCIRNRMRSMRRNERGQIRLSGFIPVDSLDDPENDDDIADDSDSPEEAFLEKESASELDSGLAVLLSRQEQDVFRLFVSGYSYGEIAHRMHTTYKSVDNAMQRVRRKLRAVWGSFNTAVPARAEP